MENQLVTTGQSEFAAARLPPADDEVIASPPASSSGLDEEPHEILDVAPEAPADAVKAVARRKMANVYPDSDNPDEEEYVRVQKAKEAMMDD